MMPVDILVKLSREKTIQEIRFFNKELKEYYESVWKEYVGEEFWDITELKVNEEAGEIRWRDERFSCLIYEETDGYRLLMKSENRQRDEDMQRNFYEQALENVPCALSIYDKSARLVYMNKACRELWMLPDYSKLVGKYITDLFDVNQEYSTGMTILRTGAPVIDRIDDYNISIGGNAFTSSTGYPIFEGGQVKGFVIYEKNLKNLDEQIRQMEEVKRKLPSQAFRFETKTDRGYTFDNFLGESSHIKTVVKLGKKIAGKDGHVMLVGETGTGKEILAQSIHRASSRAGKKFVAINCAAFPEALIEGLIFGTKKGAFTGSVDRPGLLEEADGGTLFLDELNSMSMAMQSKLLRVIQEGTFRRVGGQKDYTTNIRIISSCNQNPFALMTDGTLRKDLLFRISTMVIEIPPLREHLEDIEILVRNYIEQNHRYFTKQIEITSPQVMELFRQYTWPGNVRELYHVLEYALNVMEGDVIELQHLPSYLLNQKKMTVSMPSLVKAPFLGEEEMQHIDLEELVKQYEDQIICQMLEYHNNNISRTAQALGMKRQSLQYRLKKNERKRK